MDWNGFSPVSQSEWMAKVALENQGKEAGSGKEYMIPGFSPVSPFLTRDEALCYPAIPASPVQPGVRVTGQEEDEKNRMAIRMLENGAAVLWFDVDKDTRLPELLEGIYIDMIQLILSYRESSPETEQSAMDFLATLSNDARSRVLITGLKNNATHVYYCLSAGMDFKERMAVIDELVSHCVSQESRKAFLRIELTPDFFTQVAELRTIHRRIQQSSLQDRVFVASVSSWNGETPDDIHPMIPVVYQLFSAWIGQCSAAFGVPTGIDAELARLSLTAQHIFMEECKMNRVSDPVAGAYLTDEISRVLEKSCT